MKVLHFYKTYLPYGFAGVPRTIWEIAQGTSRFGVQTDVLSLSRNPHLGPIRVGAHFAHEARLNFDVASTGLSISAFGLFRKLAGDVDVLHYHFPYPFADVVHFASHIRKPMLVTYHSDIVRQKLLLQAYRPLMHAFLGRADRIVATSPNYLASSAILQHYVAKVTVIPIALDDAATAKPDVALFEAWRKRLDAPFFLFVGTLRYYKGLSFLIEAARLTGLPVVIIGSGGDETAVQAEAQAAGATSVTFLGQLADADKLALLALCRAFVFPSHVRTEAFGIALLEAAAAGKPMISCEIGTGTSYINLHGETGLVISPADGPALAGAMRALWADEAMAMRMGQAARERVTKLFSAEKMAKAYVSLYENLAGIRP